MKLLLCCTLVPEKYEVEIKEISNAANRFLTNLCSQIKRDNSLEILSYIGLNVDDKLKKELEHQKESNITYFFKSRGLLGGILKMLYATWKEMRNCDYVITYNVVYAWMLTPVLAKLRRKKSVLILADYSPKESYSRKKQRIYARIQQYFIGKYDFVIGLSENTKRYLKPTQKFMCMEGGISATFYNYFNQYNTTGSEKITFMYSGILEKVTGIDLLVDAFIKLDMEHIQLIITGDGSLATWVEEKAERYPTIKYLGCLPYDDYMKKLWEADILVNPRNMNLPENANNFPSKIMEYLATGKRIISTKFPGWERYQEYIMFSESNSEILFETLKRCVSEIKKWNPESFCINRKFASKYIWEKQVESIMEFLA